MFKFKQMITITAGLLAICPSGSSSTYPNVSELMETWNRAVFPVRDAFAQQKQLPRMFGAYYGTSSLNLILSRLFDIFKSAYQAKKPINLGYWNSTAAVMAQHYASLKESEIQSQDIAKKCDVLRYLLENDGQPSLQNFVDAVRDAVCQEFSVVFEES